MGKTYNQQINPTARRCGHSDLLSGYRSYKYCCSAEQFLINKVPPSLLDNLNLANGFWQCILTWVVCLWAAGYLQRRYTPMKYSTKNMMALFRFSKKTYLDDLIKGKLYVNTSETMREIEQNGRGDINESAIISHKSNSKHRSVLKNVKIGDLSFDKNSLISFYLQNPITFGDYKITDCYIQSWFALFNPFSENESKQQADNLYRTIKEFGNDFVFIDNVEALQTYLQIIETKTNLKIIGRLVDYTSDELLVSCIKKLDKFRYQQEFRILIGNCSNTEITPLVRELGDLSHLIKSMEKFEKIQLRYGGINLK